MKRNPTPTEEETKAYQLKYREDRRAEFAAYQKEYRKKNWPMLLRKKREYGARIRLEGINAYGGKCTCCGEPDHRFLTLEHLNGREEKDIYTGSKAWSKVKTKGYPKDYTVLCFNCNCAKNAYGICPHQLDQKLCGSTCTPDPEPESPPPQHGSFQS